MTCSKYIGKAQSGLSFCFADYCEQVISHIPSGRKSWKSRSREEAVPPGVQVHVHVNTTNHTPSVKLFPETLGNKAIVDAVILQSFTTCRSNSKEWYPAFWMISVCGDKPLL